MNEMRDEIISRHAIGRLGMPHEIAEAILLLSSDQSSSSALSKGRTAQ